MFFAFVFLLSVVLNLEAASKAVETAPPFTPDGKSPTFMG